VKSRLEEAIEHAANTLPAQGPITVFIHHNTLHSFEHLRFEDAVVQGGRWFGCEPFLSEERYRLELRRRRIRESDLEAVVRTDLGPGAVDSVAGFAGRLELRLDWLAHGVPEASREALSWLLTDTDVLEAARTDISEKARTRVLGTGVSPSEARHRIRDLWDACCSAASVLARAVARPEKPPVRHRDLLVAALGADPDALVHPLLIRLCAAYLDQGLASSPMPDRERGFHGSVTRLYSLGFGSPEPWMKQVRRLLSEELSDGRSALVSIERSLEKLGVPPGEWPEFLAATALALRGWAGMMRQIETRPDRVPVHAPPATLADFLAIRLLLDRAAAAEVLRVSHVIGIDLPELRSALAGRFPVPGPPSAAESAWPLFHLAQILGRNAEDVSAIGPDGIRSVFDEIDRFDGMTRRRLLHLAYERRLRHQLYDALGARQASGPRTPRFQAVFCLDEREESMRRHVEEIAPDCETFGAAGFFGVAMYYRGGDEVHARPLCPVAIQPRHHVEEFRDRSGGPLGLRSGIRRAWGHLGLGMALGSRTVLRGALGTVLLGALAAIPLLFRVLSPRLAARVLHRGRSFLSGHSGSRLVLERVPGEPPSGRSLGFSLEEMVAIVRQLIEEVGFSSIAPVVLIIGHRSTSLNNPHESAHDCGACGGSGGGPNARALAMMANHPEVRLRLARSGGRLLEGTWFVGAEHDTASDDVEYFDLDRAPEEFLPGIREVMENLADACRRNAHERCRRFRAAPLRLSTKLAHEHVEARSEDLAQTRPEYGHATNAFCIVGRRARTRGLFLDRRAFLVSYDPELDDGDSTVLARILAAVVPVVAGISLEYYFAYVDPEGYGCGTKLPHNVTALLGVMDGHASDLRTGLPRQMTEIHEPVRLILLVETEPETLRRLVAASPLLQRLVSNRWIVAAALDPGSAAIHEMRGGDFIRHASETPAAVSPGNSADWYGGRRDFLEFARIVPRVEREPLP